MATLSPPARDLAVVDTPLAELHPWDRNPRKVKPARLEQLKAMLEASPEMLQARPLIALLDGTVIAGNMRLAAARELGWVSIPCVWVDLDESEAIEWAFRDNNDVGETDEDLAAELLAELGARGRSLDVTGFAPIELRDLARRIAPRVDPDAAPPAPAKPKSKRGQVYDLGPHRLMCGDSSTDDVAILIGEDRAMLCLADPPYNVNYRGGTNVRGVAVKRERDDAYPDIFEDYAGWLTSVLAQAAAASDDQAPLMLWHSTSQLPAILSAIDGARWVQRSYIVWDKGSIQGGIGQTAKQYRTQFEPVIHCHKKGKSPRWFGPGNESDVWAVKGPRANPLHPTMKPVELYTRTLRNHSQEGDVVHESFGGSGTSLIAAEIEGRRARLMEIDPAYCDVIRQRYADYVGDQKWAP